MRTFSYTLALAGLAALLGACGTADDATSDESLESGVAGEYPPSPMPAHSIWASREACETEFAAGARATHEESAARVATWNLRWFPDGMPNWSPTATPKPTNLPWLACAIAWLDVDVIQVEEIQTTPAAKTAMNTVLAKLKELTGGDWRAEIDACSRPNSQHLGFIYDARRVTIEGAHPFHWRDGDGCNITRRPGLSAHAKFTSGLDFQFMGVHQKSKSDAESYATRLEQAKRFSVLADDTDASDDEEILVSGDFNTYGCYGSDCASPVTAEGELKAFDRVIDPLGFSRIEANNVCSEYESNSQHTLLDHFVANEKLASQIRTQAKVSGYCGELACTPYPRGTRPTAMLELSDHCPVMLDIGRAP
jgi:hypothetical protein